MLSVSGLRPSCVFSKLVDWRMKTSQESKPWPLPSSSIRALRHGDYREKCGDSSCVRGHTESAAKAVWDTGMRFLACLFLFGACFASWYPSDCMAEHRSCGTGLGHMNLTKTTANLDVQLCALSTAWTCLASCTTNGCGRTQHPMHSVRMQVDTPLGNRGFLPLYSKQHLPKDCGVQGGASVNRFMMLQMRSRHHHMSRWMTACAKERGHVTENCCDKDTFKLACTLRPLIKTFMCGRIPATYKATHMQVLSFLRCIIRVLTNGRMNAFPALETSWSQLTRSQVVRLTSPCPRMQTMWRGHCWHQVLSTCCKPSIAPTFCWTKRCPQYPLDRMLKNKSICHSSLVLAQMITCVVFFPRSSFLATPDAQHGIWEPCYISRATSTWKFQTEYKLLTRAGRSWENFGHMAGWPDDPLSSCLQHWFTTPCCLDWKHAVLQKHSCSELTAKCCHMAASLCAEKHVSNSCLKMGPPSFMHYPVAKCGSILSWCLLQWSWLSDDFSFGRRLPATLPHTLRCWQLYLVPLNGKRHHLLMKQANSRQQQGHRLNSCTQMYSYSLSTTMATYWCETWASNLYSCLHIFASSLYESTSLYSSVPTNQSQYPTRLARGAASG